MKPPLDREEQFQRDWIALAGLTAIVLWGIWWIVPVACDLPAALAGDSFGSLNALFTAAAFLGLLFQIKLQRRELRDTRAELELQRRALETQASEAREQTQASRHMIEQATREAHAKHTADVISAYIAWQQVTLTWIDHMKSVLQRLHRDGMSMPRELAPPNARDFERIRASHSLVEALDREAPELPDPESIKLAAISGGDGLARSRELSLQHEVVIKAAHDRIRELAVRLETSVSSSASAS